MQIAFKDISIFAGGLDHPECVAVHPDGSVWTGGEAGQIYRISPDGREIAELANTGGFVLGLAFSPDASWLAICDLRQRCVWRFDCGSGSLELFARGSPDRSFVTPNFPVFDRNGNLYVSDSGRFRQVEGCIFRFDASGRGELWHPGPFSFVNGMALSAAQDKLYVACTWLPGVESVTLLPDGGAGKRELLVRIPETCPDGLAVDEEGGIWISCYAPNTIYRLDPSGTLETMIHDWEGHTVSNPTNIAFGGPGRKDLYIANLGRWHIAKVPVPYTGLKLC